MPGYPNTARRCYLFSRNAIIHQDRPAVKKTSSGPPKKTQRSRPLPASLGQACIRGRTNGYLAVAHKGFSVLALQLMGILALVPALPAAPWSDLPPPSCGKQEDLLAFLLGHTLSLGYRSAISVMAARVTGPHPRPHIRHRTNYQHSRNHNRCNE